MAELLDKTFAFLDDSIRMKSSEILERSMAQSNDIVILSGTLVEGIGNKHSDIDMYVICDTLPKKKAIGDRNYLGVINGDEVRAYYDYLSQGSFGFDVEYFTRTEILSMLTEVESLYQEAFKSTKILRQTLSKEVDDALHKIHVGVTLQGGEELERIIPPNIWHKLQFIQYRNKLGGYPEFKDIMGAWISEDYDTALDNVRRYLLCQASALCHLSGSTNSKEKWIIRNVKTLSSSHPELSDNIINWIYSGYKSDKEKSDACLAACDLIDDIFQLTHGYLDVNPSIYFSKEVAIELTEREFANESFHDSQTLAEFNFRRRQFSDSYLTVREHFTTYA
ncbi:hypothetical protein ACMG4P_24780 [Pseudovibrio denitrificans]|uniref:hypothetical protein n=1 Tax=Pseudovibrio denitrificans TaxID=258256 RepID=UPI0039C0000D